MKVLGALGLVVAGLAVGLASVALHGLWWGLALAVAATSSAAYALPAGWWARVPFAAGWFAVIAYLLVPRSEGDYAIAADAHGYTLLGFALVLLVACLVTLPSRRVRPATPSGGP